MISKRVKDILEEVKVPLEDPSFYHKIFYLVSQERKKKYSKTKESIKKIAAEEYGTLSRLLDESEIQESTQVRNNLITRRLANLLVGDEGEINVSLLPSVIKEVSEHLYSLGPDRQFDAIRQERLLRGLKLLQENKNVLNALKNISKPHGHRFAENIIRDTLGLSSKTQVTNAHTRRAALSAFLCLLRQSVGSCFATAPAIIVHDEQPVHFLKEIHEMLSTGRIKRTFGGKEYAVPLCHSWGAGDLKRQIVLPVGKLSDQTRIWRSPGLISAFEAVSLVDSQASFSDKLKASRELILKTLKSWEAKRDYILVDIEAVLQKILQDRLKITEKDLKEYELRPKGMATRGVVMQNAALSSGKNRACQDFYTQFDAAKSAFKALSDNALLKSWEFTLASFAETKTQFTTWNLYSSLGLKPDEKDGIGFKLYEILKRRLDECNEKVRDYQAQYEEAYHQLQYFQSRLKSAGTEDQARWMRSQYQSKANEFYTLQEMRDTAHYKAERYSNLFDELLDAYFKLFPRFFQEVYDPDMHEVSVGPYDDQPAGFRLLYKHGRSNTSMWTLIYNHGEYVDALANFFTVTETEIAGMPFMEGLGDDLAEIVTAIVNHVRTKEFIESAFYRMAAAHKGKIVKDPLDHLDKIEKKPWVYTSGGSLHTLVSTYFRLEERPTEVDRWVENPLELLVFFVDTMKHIPDKIMEQYIVNPGRSMLIHSPTHAFLLKPGLPWFRKAWENKTFTYTWLRDYVVKPMDLFSEQMFLDEDKMQFVVEQLIEYVPEPYKPYFKENFYHMRGSMLVWHFRDHILGTIEKNPRLHYAGGNILSEQVFDEVLYRLLPLFPSYKLKENIEAILSEILLPEGIKQEILTVYEEISGKKGAPSIVSAKGLQDIVKALICLVTSKTSMPQDFHQLIAQRAQALSLMYPKPFIFADTNWVKDSFGFVVNPGTGKLELWRLDYAGTSGSPMHMWETWLNGSRKEPTWGIFTKPYEYLY